MADNPDRLAQIMQRMQLSNQRSVGNRLGGANGVTSGATAPTPPSEPIDFSRNTLSPPSMAEPDDTGPGQQMPSVIQPPASGNVGMPSGGNAYSGNQQGVSPSTRDLYSLPDYSGGMGGGNSGGGFDVGRLLKMLSSYMGSQNGQPSAAPPPAPSANMPVNEYKPGYTRTSVPAGIKAPDPFTATTSAMGEMYNTNTGQRYTTTSGGYSAEPGSGWVSQGQPGYVATTSGGTPRQATPDMPVNEYQPGYTPATPRALPKGLKQSNMAATVMENYYNAQTGERFDGGPGMAEPGSGWSTRGQPGYVARDYSKEPPPDLARLGGLTGARPPGAHLD